MPELELTVASGQAFDVRRFASREAVSQLFEVQVMAYVHDPSLDLEGIVGKASSFTSSTGLDDVTDRRRWDGVIRHAELSKGVVPQAGERALSAYTFKLVPKLWLLDQRRNQRIFQHLSIPGIVRKLLEEWSVPAVWAIEEGDYPVLEYTVQYGESDYAFCSRLLEEAGISFTFPSDGRDACVVTFGDSLHTAPVREPTIHFVDRPNEASEKEYVTDLVLRQEVRPGAFAYRDVDFRSPAFQLFGRHEDGMKELEQYHFRPGRAWTEGKASGGDTPAADDKGVSRTDQSYLTEQAERSLHAARMGRAAVDFRSNVTALGPGTVVHIEHHPHADLATPLLMTDLEIQGNTAGEEWAVRGTGTFNDTVFHSPRTTAKPAIHGVQSATVVGPAGQEIHTDEFGRVRVQFPWDREGRSDDNSSVWMRVSQGWAGTGFGMINIPRIGQEVLVGFLEGDPDQPLVVGRVFNAVEQVPYKLPENKTVSGWKTQSSPGAGGYNEIKLEDKAGLELFYVQAQRDYDELIKNDETARTIGHHKKTVVKDQDLVVKQSKRELIEADDSLHVKGHRRQRIDGSTSLIVDEDQHERVGNLHALSAGREIHLEAGTQVVMEAGSRLTIKGPGGFIDIHGGGIDIVGTVVNINSGGSAGNGSGAMPIEPHDAQEAEPKDHSS